VPPGAAKARSAAVRQWQCSAEVPSHATQAQHVGPRSSAGLAVGKRTTERSGCVGGPPGAAQASRAQVAGDALLLSLFASCELVVWVQPRGAPDTALLHQLRALQAGARGPGAVVGDASGGSAATSRRRVQHGLQSTGLLGVESVAAHGRIYFPFSPIMPSRRHSVGGGSVPGWTTPPSLACIRSGG